jgi:hypothetical protein
VTSPNIQGLELATPKAESMAVKNAIKKLGGLFGKYLNRVEDEIIEEPQMNLEEKMESLPEAIKKHPNYRRTQDLPKAGILQECFTRNSGYL